MNKATLIKAVAKECGISQDKCAMFVNGFVKIIEESIAQEEPICIKGFGVFKPVTRKATRARNPKTQEMHDVPERKEVIFRAGIPFKKKLN